MSFSGQPRLHWIPLGTQLSPVAPRSCSMRSGHTPVTALAGGLNQVEGSRSGLKPSGEQTRDCLPMHVKTGFGRPRG